MTGDIHVMQSHGNRERISNPISTQGNVLSLVYANGSYNVSLHSKPAYNMYDSYYASLDDDAISLLASPTYITKSVRSVCNFSRENHLE